MQILIPRLFSIQAPFNYLASINMIQWVTWNHESNCVYQIVHVWVSAHFSLSWSAGALLTLLICRHVLLGLSVYTVGSVCFECPAFWVSCVMSALCVNLETCCPHSPNLQSCADRTCVYTVGSLCPCTSHVAHVAAVLVSCSVVISSILMYQLLMWRHKGMVVHTLLYMVPWQQSILWLFINKTHSESDLQRSSSLWQCSWTTPS